MLGESSPEVKSSEKVKSVLGMKWNIETDELLFSFENTLIHDFESDSQTICKRLVLKIISSVFDTIGVLGPAVIVLKLMVQELCSMKCSWDEQLED